MPIDLSFFSDAFDLELISKTTTPEILIHLSIIVVLFGHIIIYFLSRTDYGVKKTKIDIRTVNNQDFLVAPILIGVPIFISGFVTAMGLMLFAQTIFDFLIYLGLLTKLPENPVVGFYIFFIIVLLSDSRKLITKSQRDGKILHNSFDLIFNSIIVLLVSILIAVASFFLQLTANMVLSLRGLSFSILQSNFNEISLVIFSLVLPYFLVISAIFILARWRAKNAFNFNKIFGPNPMIARKVKKKSKKK